VDPGFLEQGKGEKMKRRRVNPVMAWAGGILVLAAGGRLLAAEPGEYECRRAEGKITIDGKGDDEAWKKAQTIDGFGVPWLTENKRPPKSKATARMLWDDEYLYFQADLEDHDLFADIVEHDGMTWHNDVFEIFFKPLDKDPGYYEFQVNAAGTMMDMFLPSRDSGGSPRWKGAHKFTWEAKVSRRGTLNQRGDRDEGWSVEGRFPWSDFAPLGGKPKPDQVWKFAFCRYDYDKDWKEPDTSTSAPLTKPSFHRHEDYGPVRFKE
jgi:hypothetical protein